MAAKDMLDTNTKDLIAEALRMIMMEKPFENIRIKDICDRVGVVRVTFYNYFIDKYAALEYLIEKDLILPNENRIREGKFEEMISR
ncbi:MAG: TetR family transcriptional regulator [Erysipelotrichales bacterium]|nr:TetR family transcriptional regulator [Erysipelotrichales bacterium]